MRRMFFWLAAAIFGIGQTAACANAAERTQEFKGWARIKGEVMLYDTRAAMIGRKQSHCVSGMSPHTELDALKKFDRRKVIVTGRKISYQNLPNEDTPVLKRKILGDAVISNFCYKNEVISIQRIRLAR